MKIRIIFTGCTLIVTALLAVLFLTGCSYPHMYHSPNMMSVPLFQKGPEFSGILAGSFGTVNPSFEMQTAFAIPGHAGLGFDFMTGGKDNSEDNYTDFSKYSYFDFFGGYYTSFSKIGVFELYAGYGEGSQDHTFAYNDWNWGDDWVQDGTAEMKFSKIFIQPDIGIRNKTIEGAFSLRLSRVNFKQVNYSNTVYRLDELRYLDSHRISWLLEPGFTFRVGQDPVKFHLQLVYSPNISYSSLKFEHFRFNFGIDLKFGKKKSPAAE